MSTSAWQAEVTSRARAYWTEAQRHAVFGDKVLALEPIDNAPLLRGLGLMQRDASFAPASVRKFMQINHLLVLLEPPLRDLMAVHPTVRVLDVGCGSSYLTLLLAWCFAHRWQHPCEIVGIDERAIVIDKSRERADKLGLATVLRFEQWRAETTSALSFTPHAVFALHACDTASDAALALAIDANAELIGVAPCCHAELAQQWSAQPPAQLSVLATSPHLRREAAATCTDALRLAALRARGYIAQAIEFVPSPHTPKNTLLKAKRGSTAGDVGEYLQLRATLGEPRLALDAIALAGRGARPAGDASYC